MSGLSPEINAVIDGYVADLRKAKDEVEWLRDALVWIAANSTDEISQKALDALNRK